MQFTKDIVMIVDCPTCHAKRGEECLTFTHYAPKGVNGGELIFLIVSLNSKYKKSLFDPSDFWRWTRYVHAYHSSRSSFAMKTLYASSMLELEVMVMNHV